MLVQITISDFAIIGHLEIHFRQGLNILSGETGAGKSIIINAVNLLLGERASGDLIRTGAEEARVEALFHLPQSDPIRDILTTLGIPFDGDILIKRVISREGRNKILINGSLATLQMLSRIGTRLISISGQHEHQSLLKPDNHLYILDDFGGLSKDRQAFRNIFNEYRSLMETFHSLEKEIREAEERQDLTRFQMDEIDRADIKENEDVHLEEERKLLQYAAQLIKNATIAYQVLYENESAIISQLSFCAKELEKGAEMEGTLKAVREIMVSAQVELEEAALDLRNFQQRFSHDPARLEGVEDRLQILKRLKRKYGPSLEQVIQFRDRLSTEEGNLAQKKEDLDTVRSKMRVKEGELLSGANELSRKRKGAAGELEKAIARELNLLDMKGTRFEVAFATNTGDRGQELWDSAGALGPDGCDNVEFLLSANVGEDLKPLSKIASGGELSRIMLAMKTILARSTSVETIVFDEVDSGIGGGTAEVVGDKLQTLAAYHQLLCISHLHQIASKGTTHFKVEKKVIGNRTQTVISELDAEGRVKEIARMLGGKTVSAGAMAHARELLS